MKTNKIKIEPRWSQSREEIWNERFAGLEDRTPAKKLPLKRSRRIGLYAAAAVLVIALLVPAAGYLYTDTVHAPKGERLSVTLPDGSTVAVNADTRLRYKPLWWKISREVKLDGEACFQVAKGSAFRVHSGDAVVTVLGTEFNVFSRGNDYRVTCLTGRVEVTKARQSVILTPGMQAVYENDRLGAGTIPDAVHSIGWTTGRFIFNGVPLSQVIQEIERQYAIEVVAPGVKQNHIYTGNFSRTDNPEEVLRIIGTPFGLELTIKQPD